MAYSPLARAGRLRNGLLKKCGSQRNCTHAHNISAAQVLLAWVISHQGDGDSKAATVAHVQQNAAVLEVELSSAELVMLDVISGNQKRKNCAGYV